MKNLLIFGIFVVCVTSSKVVQKRSQVIRLAFPPQVQAQAATQALPYTVQSENQISAPQVSHEEFVHQHHAHLVAAQQQQKLAKLAFGPSHSSVPAPVITHGPQGTFRIAQSQQVNVSPQTHYKYILPQHHHQHLSQHVPYQHQPQQTLQTVVAPHPQSLSPTQLVPVKLPHPVPAPAQALRLSPVQHLSSVPVPVHGTHQYVVTHHHFDSPQQTKVVHHTPQLAIDSSSASQTESQPQPQPQQQPQPQLQSIPAEVQQQPQQAQLVRSYNGVTPARVSSVPISLQGATQISTPQTYSQEIPSAAIRNVNTVAITKSITPIITKTTQKQIHSEPALTFGKVDGYSQTASGPGKVAEVVYNTRYTTYSNPTVGLSGPVTFAGPVESMGASAGANAIIALLSGQASGSGLPSSIRTLSQPQIVSHGLASPPAGEPSVSLIQPQIQSQIPLSAYQRAIPIQVQQQIQLQMQQEFNEQLQLQQLEQQQQLQQHQSQQQQQQLQQQQSQLQQQQLQQQQSQLQQQQLQQQQLQQQQLQQQQLQQQQSQQQEQSKKQQAEQQPEQQPLQQQQPEQQQPQQQSQQQLQQQPQQTQQQPKQQVKQQIEADPAEKAQILQIPFTQFQQAQPLPQPLSTETPTSPTPSLIAIPVQEQQQQQQQQPQYSVPLQSLGQSYIHGRNPLQLQVIQSHPPSRTSTELGHPIQQLEDSSFGDTIGNALQELTSEARNGLFNYQSL